MPDTKSTRHKDDDDVARQISKLSDEIFDLAKQAARGAGDREARHKRALAINGELRELQPALDDLPAAERSEAGRSLADAQVDVMYVLSDGRAPASLRLNSSGAIDESAS